VCNLMTNPDISGKITGADFRTYAENVNVGIGVGEHAMELNT
jgi:hypothetical protein